MKSRKLFLFQIIALLIPLFLLIAVESILRVTGSFSREPLFLTTTVNGAIKYQVNPTVSRRYFNPRQVALPTMLPETFTYQKDENTLRLFCLGGSTTAGFPFKSQVPFPQQLKYLLEDAYPQTRFEVINLGLSAINSFSVMNLLPEVLEEDPDLIVVYMGHNEFYGAYGSGSAISIGQNRNLIRLSLWLQQFHTVQLIKSVLMQLAPASSGDQRMLMEEMIGDRGIALDSDKYRRTMANFAANYDWIIDRCQRAGVPIVIGNLVSNIKDLAPFASSQGGLNNMRSENLEEVRVQFEKASEESALKWYQLGQAFVEQKNWESARSCFSEAKDRDLIRFRAAEGANTIIAGLTDKYQVPLADVYREFITDSPNGLIGHELICDHLHPNPQGYYLMARAFYTAIMIADLFDEPTAGFNPPTYPYDVTTLDWEIGYLDIFQMVHRFPFPAKEVTIADYRPFGDSLTARIAREYLYDHRDWGRAHADLADIYSEDSEYEKARREYRAMHRYFPENPGPYVLMARTYAREENWRWCEAFYRRAAHLSPEDGMIHYQLAQACWKIGKFDDAIASMEKAAGARDFTSEQKINARYYLAGYYAESGRAAEAILTLQKIVQEKPDFQPAHEFLRKLSPPSE